MSRKSGGIYNVVFAIVVLVGAVGVLGISSLNLRVSAIGGIIIIVAVLESALIAGGIVFLNRKQPRPGATGDSN